MINPNSPAFPRIDNTIDEPGMSIRTKLAAMAMQGFLAYGMANPERVASDSVQYADALIEELNKRNKGGSHNG